MMREEVRKGKAAPQETPSPLVTAAPPPGEGALSSTEGTRLDRFFAYAKLLLRPSYHLRKIVDDLRAARHALAQWDLDSLRGDEAILTRAFRGRLFATFLLSGMFGVFGPILGTVNQYVTKNPTEGFLVGLLIANLFGTIGFQIIWWLAHQRMYRARQLGMWQRFLALERDLLPLQWDGLRFTALFLLVTVPIMLGLIHLLESLAAPVATVIPFPVIGVVVEMVVIHSSLVRVMGDLFEKHAARIGRSFQSERAS
jgi:hypothetical protein